MFFLHNLAASNKWLSEFMLTSLPPIISIQFPFLSGECKSLGLLRRAPVLQFCFSPTLFHAHVVCIRHCILHPINLLIVLLCSRDFFFPPQDLHLQIRSPLQMRRFVPDPQSFLFQRVCGQSFLEFEEFRL